MNAKRKVRVAFFDFTCCEGCQVELTNLSDPVFVSLLPHLEFVEWREVMSEKTAEPIDIAFVEGSFSREADRPRLKVLVDELERIAFIERLISSARDEPRKTTVVIALRADFYAHCAQYPLLREAVAAEQEFIGQMIARLETEVRRHENIRVWVSDGVTGMIVRVDPKDGVHTVRWGDKSPRIQDPLRLGWARGALWILEGRAGRIKRADWEAP